MTASVIAKRELRVSRLTRKEMRWMGTVGVMQQESLVGFIVLTPSRISRSRAPGVDWRLKCSGVTCTPTGKGFPIFSAAVGDNIDDYWELMARPALKRRVFYMCCGP